MVNQAALTETLRVLEAEPTIYLIVSCSNKPLLILPSHLKEHLLLKGKYASHGYLLSRNISKRQVVQKSLLTS